MIASSALNFLAVKVILELKTAIDKGSSIKSPTGGGFSQPSGGDEGLAFPLEATLQKTPNMLCQNHNLNHHSSQLISP